MFTACGNSEPSLVGRWEVAGASMAGNISQAELMELQEAIAIGSFVATYEFFEDGRLSVFVSVENMGSQSDWYSWSSDNGILWIHENNGVRDMSYRFSGSELIIREPNGPYFYLQRVS